MLGVCLCTHNNCVGTCTQRPEQGIGYPPLFLFTYHLEAGYVTEPARPNEFLPPDARVTGFTAPRGFNRGSGDSNSGLHVCKSKCSYPLSNFFSYMYHACVLEFQWEQKDTGSPCLRQSFGCSSCICRLIGTLVELPGILRS